MKKDINLHDELSKLLGNRCPVVESNGAVCFNQRAKYKNTINKYCHKHAGRLYHHNSFDLPKKENKKCIFIDCNEPFRSRNYCMKHYKQFIAGPKRKLYGKRCSVPNCKNVAKNKDLCDTHHYRLKRNGDINIVRTTTKHCLDPEIIKRRNETNRKYYECISPECDKKYPEYTHFRKGLCSKHYMRWIKYGTYNLPVKDLK